MESKGRVIQHDLLSLAAIRERYANAAGCADEDLVEGPVGVLASDLRGWNVVNEEDSLDREGEMIIDLSEGEFTAYVASPPESDEPGPAQKVASSHSWWGYLNRLPTSALRSSGSGVTDNTGRISGDNGVRRYVAGHDCAGLDPSAWTNETGASYEGTRSDGYVITNYELSIKLGVNLSRSKKSHSETETDP